MCVCSRWKLARPQPLHANHRKPRNKVAPVAEPVVLAHEVLGEPWSVARALCGTFTLVQTLLGACLGFGITFGIFHLLTAGAPWHDWASDKVLFALLGSPFFTAVFAPMFVPMAMPEAAAKGWIGFVPVERLPPPLQCLPFLRASRALTRHLLLGVAVAALWIPGGLFVLTQLLTPPFSGFTVALFAGCYVVSLSLVVFPIGLLGFLLEPNYDRAISMMSVEENPLTRLVERVLLVPLA